MAGAKFEGASVNAKGQDVIFAFVNNDQLTNSNRTQSYDLSPEFSLGINWFGSNPAANYILAASPDALAWGTERTGQDLIDNGLTITQPIARLGQA